MIFLKACQRLARDMYFVQFLEKVGLNCTRLKKHIRKAYKLHVWI